VWSGAGTQVWASGILAQVAVRLRAAAPAEHLRQVGGPKFDFLRKDPDRARAKLKAIEMARRTTTQFWKG
ncbi:MAG: hypothetical protein KDC02_02110, partial [Flavobacteriales bacterium]|nr:hypothetical protein [Flavobacteriales bacterium]